MTIDNELYVLDDLVRRLKVEYERYFEGKSAGPPADRQIEVERLLAKLSVMRSFGFMQRYKYSEISQHYAIYRDLWKRKARFREDLKSKQKVDAAKGNPTSTTSDFDILDVSPTCSDVNLRKAYRKKMSEWHPDKLNGMAPELRQVANDKCAEINLAYERIQRLRGTATR
jgi:hypothetical protein